MKKIYLAGGCFWGVEHYMSLIQGVQETTVGYANSDILSPSYEDLKTHRSSASETVEVVYDETIISLKEILDLFYQIIDPTILDQQGHDIGHQYRTGIYYVDEEDKTVIEESLKKLAEQYKKPIVTELLKLDNFTKAEDYHQDYLIKNPQGYCHVDLKMFEVARNYHPHGRE
ncbi:MAG: peptide-methionine (S)-S-oxide reductase MsrA [Erysipelotrichaceae bacterium]|nr:peptide-methionine (S)-S-oxide reductase MsrA [Erysipelotrichaceae bacterium]